MLELAFETFARQWGTQLTAKVRVMSQVTSEQVIMHTYDEYAASLPSTTAMVLCALDGLAAKAVIQFPTSVGPVLGRPHARRHRPPRPHRTASSPRSSSRSSGASWRTPWRTCDYSLGSLLGTSISVDSIQYNSQFAQAAATTELMIVASFTVRVGENTATATVAIPADAVLPQLGETNPTITSATPRNACKPNSPGCRWTCPSRLASPR